MHLLFESDGLIVLKNATSLLFGAFFICEVAFEGKWQPLRSEFRGVTLPGVTSASFKMAELSLL